MNKFLFFVCFISSAKQETSTITRAIRDTLIKPKWWWTCVSKFLSEVIAGDTMFTLLTTDELSGLATQAGLHVKRCEQVEEYFNFDSRKEFKSFLHTILQPHGINNMHEEDQQQLLDEVVEKYCTTYDVLKDPAKVKHTFLTLRLTASKPAQ